MSPKFLEVLREYGQIVRLRRTGLSKAWQNVEDAQIQKDRDALAQRYDEKQRQLDQLLLTEEIGDEKEVAGGSGVLVRTS